MERIEKNENETKHPIFFVKMFLQNRFPFFFQFEQEREEGEILFEECRQRSETHSRKTGQTFLLIAFLLNLKEYFIHVLYQK